MHLPNVKWKISHDEHAPLAETEVLDITIYQRPLDDHWTHSHAGPLAIVPVPPNNLSRSRFLKRRHRALLRKLFDKFGYEIFSAQDALKIGSPRPMGMLWAHGHLIKYARGEFNGSAMGYNTNGEVYGVHYKVKQHETATKLDTPGLTTQSGNKVVGPSSGLRNRRGGI